MPNQALKSGLRRQMYLNDTENKLFNFFDSSFQQIAYKFNAKEKNYPALLDATFLRKIEYFSSFPHQALVVCRYRKDSSSGNQIIGFLPRAMCYHYFASLWLGENLIIERDIVTTLGHCFRYEDFTNRYRLKTFTMREIIFHDSPIHVVSTSQDISQKIIEFADNIGIGLTRVQAQDPFFMPLAKGKYTMQKLQPLKYEFCFQSVHGPVALSSSNHHLNFFMSKLLKQKELHSGCVAFGLERWIRAFMERHGDKVKNWPPLVCKKLHEQDIL